MKKKKVLVVDDELSFREPIAELLAVSGYFVATVASGIEALEIMKDNLPDMVLTDIKMPEMDGFTLLEKIKKDHPDIPVLLMSACPNIDDNPTKYQPTCFFNKPIDLEAILMKIDYALSWGSL